MRKVNVLKIAMSVYNIIVCNEFRIYIHKVNVLIIFQKFIYYRIYFFVSVNYIKFSQFTLLEIQS